jgi:DUF971 family protein
MKALLQCRYRPRTLRVRPGGRLSSIVSSSPRRASPSPRFERMSIPQPTEIALHQASRLIEIAFSDGAVFRLPCEFLRVYSPSAEVRGHGSDQQVLQVGKREVQIAAIEPVGSYAVRFVFSDGHDTGLYSWEYLYGLGKNQDRLWREYLDRLAQAGGSRDPDGGGSERVARRSGPPAGWKKM